MSTNIFIKSLCLIGGSLYVGGIFTSIDGVFHSLISLNGTRTTGTRWVQERMLQLTHWLRTEHTLCRWLFQLHRRCLEQIGKMGWFIVEYSWGAKCKQRWSKCPAVEKWYAICSWWFYLCWKHECSADRGI